MKGVDTSEIDNNRKIDTGATGQILSANAIDLLICAYNVETLRI